MPQIGWLEILAVVIIAILVLGPKEFPIALKKIASEIFLLDTDLGMANSHVLLGVNPEHSISDVINNMPLQFSCMNSYEMMGVSGGDLTLSFPYGGVALVYYHPFYLNDSRSPRAFDLKYYPTQLNHLPAASHAY